MAPLRSAWPDIQTALRNGHSLERICQCLNEDGFAIAYKTLSSYLAPCAEREATARAPAEAGPPNARSRLAQACARSPGEPAGTLDR
jgi:hypothetical protein